LPSDLLETRLKKPNRGEGFISRKPRPKSAHDFLGLLYCFIVLLCIYVVSSPYVIYLSYCYGAIQPICSGKSEGEGFGGLSPLLPFEPPAIV